MSDYVALSANVHTDGPLWKASITVFRPGKPDTCIWLNKGFASGVEALSALRNALAELSERQLYKTR